MYMGDGWEAPDAENETQKKSNVNALKRIISAGVVHLFN